MVDLLSFFTSIIWPCCCKNDFKYNNGGGLLSSVLLFRDAAKIQNGRQRSTRIFFVGAKTLILKVINYSNYHIPHDMEMCRWLFQSFTEIQNGRHRSIFWLAQKICLVNFLFYFTITFLETWGFASGFLKMLQKFKMAARGQLQIFLWVQKLQNSKSQIIQIDITFPTIWRFAGDFRKVLLKLKWPPQIKLFLGGGGGCKNFVLSIFFSILTSHS